MLRQLDANVYPLVEMGLIEEAEWKRVSQKLAMLNDLEETEEEFALL